MPLARHATLHPDYAHRPDGQSLGNLVMPEELKAGDAMCRDYS